MARNLLVISLIALFTYSLWVYLNRDARALIESVREKDNQKPKVELENFAVQRYKNSVLTMRAQANIGQLLEPNTLELLGDFRFDQYRDGKRERVSSDSAVAYFKSDEGKGLAGGGQLLNVKLRRDVRVDFEPYRLLTDFAEYLADEDAIVSERPVTVIGEKRWFRGQGGFRADLERETVDIMGKVSGEAALE